MLHSCFEGEHKMKNNFKMIHIRNPRNVGVVSFRTKVDFEQNIIVWDMVVCSKKDTFIKSKSMELCGKSPLKSGIVSLHPAIIKILAKESFGAGYNHTHIYFDEVVIHDAMTSKTLVNSDGDARHQPEWVDELLAGYYTGFND